MEKIGFYEYISELTNKESIRRIKLVDERLRAELTLKGWDVEKLLRSRWGKRHCKGIATVMYDGDGKLLGVDARRPCWWEKRLWGVKSHDSN